MKPSKGFCLWRRNHKALSCEDSTAKLLSSIGGPNEKSSSRNARLSSRRSARMSSNNANLRREVESGGIVSVDG